MRKRKGLNQAELAEKIGVSSGSVAAWELARYMPAAEQWERLLVFFGDESDQGKHRVEEYLLSGAERYPERAERYPDPKPGALPLKEAGSLPEELGEIVRRAAAETGVSEGEIIEACVREKVDDVVMRMGRKAVLNDREALREVATTKGTKNTKKVGSVELGAPAQNEGGN